MTTVERVNANDVIEALKAEYGGFRMLHPKGIFEALMTGEQWSVKNDRP